MSFVESSMRGSVLSVMWKRDLVVLSFTVLMCFFQQIKLLSLPELLAHSLEMTASMKLYVQHGVRLHGEGNGILRLVGSTRQHISLSLQLAHGSQT